MNATLVIVCILVITWLGFIPMLVLGNIYQKQYKAEMEARGCYISEEFDNHEYCPNWKEMVDTSK